MRCQKRRESTHGIMTFLDFPLALLACTFDRTSIMDVFKDIALLHLVKNKKHSDAVRKEHDLSCIVPRRHRGSRLAHRCGHCSGKRKGGALGDYRGVHEEDALVRLTFEFT